MVYDESLKRIDFAIYVTKVRLPFRGIHLFKILELNVLELE